MTKIIEPSYEILEYPTNAIQKIERAARACYKSEDKISDGSAERFVKNLIKRRHMAMIEFGGMLTVKFVSNRGFTHELVRHRLASFAQESTRYCNYSQGKFDSRITICKLDGLLSSTMDGTGSISTALLILLRSWQTAEDAYFALINLGVRPEIAREVLPIGLKAEIVIQANVREWRHIFEQRTSPAAHPRMRELMRPLLVECRRLMPVIFDDVGVVE